MKIYTKTGDSGDTSLYGGERRSKADLRIQAYGEVDELQAQLGVVLAHLPAEGFADVREVLQDIQFHGFVLCSELARTVTKKERKDPSITPDIIQFLETSIDHFEEELSPLRAFIMQGGAPAGASLHVARAVCRRAERSIVLLAKKEQLSESCLQYINRLSDLLFVLARLVNHRLSQPELEWHVKG